jgi:hypothetical protein
MVGSSDQEWQRAMAATESRDGFTKLPRRMREQFVYLLRGICVVIHTNYLVEYDLRIAT